MGKLILVAIAVLGLASQARALSTTYNVTLAPEVVGATGSGSATIVYDDVLHSLSIDTDWTGLSGFTTVAHIHCCVIPPGTVGVAVTPTTFPGFPTGLQSGTYSIVLDLTLAGTYTTGFLNGAGGTPALAEAALFTGMNQGRAYLNIHSNLFPTGEIRGFLAAVPEPGVAALVAGAMVLLHLARRREV
jgi:hypothetical protein